MPMIIKDIIKSLPKFAKRQMNWRLSVKFRTCCNGYRAISRDTKHKIRANFYAKVHSNAHETPKNGQCNVAFFGSDEFALESLKTLHNKYKSKTLHRLEIITVNKGKENAVVQYGKEHGIVINSWPLQENLSNFHIGIVVSFGQYIPSCIINSFPLGILNVHASLLPRWRGAAPIIYSLMNGDLQTGVTIMKIAPKKFDIGEIVMQKQIDVGIHETLPELHKKLAKLGADLLVDTFENLPQILQTAKPQNEANVTYAPRITSKISLIKWSDMTAKNVYDLQRALSGLYTLTTKFENMTIKLFGIHVIEKPPIAAELQHEIPGVVTYDKKSKVLVAKCKGESWISVQKLLIPGRSTITARDFYNGFLAGPNKRKIFFQ